MLFSERDRGPKGGAHMTCTEMGQGCVKDGAKPEAWQEAGSAQATGGNRGEFHLGERLGGCRGTQGSDAFHLTPSCLGQWDPNPAEGPSFQNSLAMAAESGLLTVRKQQGLGAAAWTPCPTRRSQTPLFHSEQRIVLHMARSSPRGVRNRVEFKSGASNSGSLWWA